MYWDHSRETAGQFCCTTRRLRKNLKKGDSVGSFLTTWRSGNSAGEDCTNTGEADCV